MNYTYENGVGNPSRSSIAKDGVVATPVVDQKHPDTQGVVMKPGNWPGTGKSGDTKLAVRLETCHWRGLDRLFKKRTKYGLCN